jgi:hypothetical protein
MKYLFKQVQDIRGSDTELKLSGTIDRGKESAELAL